MGSRFHGEIAYQESGLHQNARGAISALCRLLAEEGVDQALGQERLGVGEAF